ncbi:hypothetical protein EYF80_046951 [Liparis tanakae]|uniref:Uncharacterized protein n=1 Tax=Liparis tanakae TaxID=230148 RepID=A0A4Z2FPX5_9TELE|nr:hypothetical protein EYF80_046951 [Liparis tanakae]
MVMEVGPRFLLRSLLKEKPWNFTSAGTSILQLFLKFSSSSSIPGPAASPQLGTLQYSQRVSASVLWHVLPDSVTPMVPRYAPPSPVAQITSGTMVGGSDAERRRRDGPVGVLRGGAVAVVLRFLGVPALAGYLSRLQCIDCSFLSLLVAGSTTTGQEMDPPPNEGMFPSATSPHDSAGSKPTGPFPPGMPSEKPDHELALQ